MDNLKEQRALLKKLLQSVPDSGTRYFLLQFRSKDLIKAERVQKIRSLDFQAAKILLLRH